MPATAPVEPPPASLAAIGGGNDAAPPPAPRSDDAWAEEPWPPTDPWATATPSTVVVPAPSSPAPTAATIPAASAGSEPGGLDLLRSVFPGRVLQVVSDASDAAVERGTGTAPPDPLDPVDPDDVALDPDPGGPP